MSVFLDDDVVLFENYYEKVLHYFDNDKKIGGLSGNIIIENKSRSWKGKIWRTLQKLFLLDNFDGKMTSSGLDIQYMVLKVKMRDLCKLRCFQVVI